MLGGHIVDDKAKGLRSRRLPPPIASHRGVLAHSAGHPPRARLIGQRISRRCHHRRRPPTALQHGTQMSAFSSALTSLFTACASAPKRKRKSEMDRSGSRLPQLRGSGGSRSPLEGKGSNSPVSRVGMRLAERPKSMYDIPVSLVDAASPGSSADEHAAAAARPTRLQLQAHQPKACATVPGGRLAASGAPVDPPSSAGQPRSPASEVGRSVSPAVDSSDRQSNGRSLASGEPQNAGKVGSTFGFAGSNGISRPSSRPQPEPNAGRLAFRSPSATVAKSALPGASAAPTGLRPAPAHGHQAAGCTVGSDQPTQLPEQQQHQRINGRRYDGLGKAATGGRDDCTVPVTASEPPGNGTEPACSATALRNGTAAADAAVAPLHRPSSLGNGRTAIGGGRRPGDRRSTAGAAADAVRGRVCDSLGVLSSSQEANGLDRRHAAAAEALSADGQVTACPPATSDDTGGELVVGSERAVVAKPRAAAAPRQSRFGLLNLGAASRRDDVKTGKALQPSGEQPNHSRLNGSHSGASSLSNLSELGQNTHLTYDDERASPLLNGSDSLTTLASGRNDDARFGSTVNVLALQDNVSMQLMLLEMADEVRALRAGLSELQRELQHEETMRHRLQLECAEKDTCIADLRRQLGVSTS